MSNKLISNDRNNREFQQGFTTDLPFTNDLPKIYQKLENI